MLKFVDAICNFAIPYYIPVQQHVDKKLRTRHIKTEYWL